MFKLLRWAALPLLALGDGELFMSSSTTTTTSLRIDCNPYDGHQFFIFGNGNGITSAQCTASWDLYEIFFWDENGDPITVSGASDLTGNAGSEYIGSNAVDGDRSTFFAGDHDIGMSCSCWDNSSLDGQSLWVDLGGTKKVSKIMLLQGGAGDQWAISKIRIHCGNGYQTHPLPLQISFVASENKPFQKESSLSFVTGDGPAFLSTSTTIIPGTSNVTFDCNPYDGVNYIIFGNGNGITATSCGSSWDLHEIQMWDENGVQIALSSAEALTGSDSGYPASQTIDGHSSTFWAGDHDIGMSCDCWDSSKKDGQSIRVNLGATFKVSKIRLLQGGAGNTWAISKIRIHCGTAYQANPLPLDISFGTTDIECNDAGCATISMDPGYYHTCDAAATSFPALAFLSVAASFL